VVEVLLEKGAHPALDAAAEKSAWKLGFKPASLRGAPVAVRLAYAYEFVPPPPQSRGTVTGVVRARGTRRPIVGASILLETAEVATSDERGRFSLVLGAGPQMLTVSAPGYKAATLVEEVVADQLVEVVYRLEPLVVDPYETVVRGDKERTEVSRHTLTEQELREVPGTMGDPFRVVMLLPGVSGLASGLSYPVIRGAQPAATGYFVDGVRVPALFHLLVGPAVVHPEFLDRVDYYPGIPPLRYGRFLGGAVEGQASRPRDDRFHATGYADLINAGAFVEYPFKDTGTHVTLSGRFSYTALLFDLVSRALAAPDPEGYRTRPVAGFWDYQGRIEQSLADGKFRLLAFGSSDEAGMEAENRWPLSQTHRRWRPRTRTYLGNGIGRNHRPPG
jgi:hypothetical protein